MSDSKPDAIQRLDGSVHFNSGQILARVHHPNSCMGDVCPIHNPTDHELRGEQLFFNGRHMVRRVGDELRIDPDDFYYLKTGSAILRNSATCALCGDSIQSTNRHDYVSCACGAISVDGGLDYLRRSSQNDAAFIDTSVTVGNIDY